MSLEDELTEISAIHHGAEEYIQELEAGMRDCTTKIAALEEVINGLFEIAPAGSVKNSLWRRYQQIVAPAHRQVVTEPQEPLAGDIYVLEVRTGRFTIHRYDGKNWQQLGGGHSAQDVQTLTRPMQFLWESRGHRRYYRPRPPKEPLEGISGI